MLDTDGISGRTFHEIVHFKKSGDNNKKACKITQHAEINHTQVGIVYCLLTLCILMNSSISFDTMSMGWFTVYIKGSQVRVSKLRCTLVPDS